MPNDTNELLYLYESADPMVWAEAFEETVDKYKITEFDAGFMVGWFSNFMSALENCGWERPR